MPSVSVIPISSPATLIVEGSRDSEAVHRVLDCTVIETRGMDVEGAFPDIRAALIKGEVFVFTDSDPSGERIRQIVHQETPGCKDARVIPNSGRQYARVESASDIQILEALRTANFELRYSLPVISAK